MSIKVQLTLRTTPTIPMEAESLLPENMMDKSKDEIKSMPLLAGNRMETVGDHFHVETTENPQGGQDGENGLPTLELTGNLTRFKRLGEAMSGGTMIVNGSAGFHAGAQMSGGVLTITGNTGDYLGAMMTGGRIVVHGSAGHFTGSAYRGFTSGMSGGTILIHGDAGNLTGARMRRGTIAVRGACGDLAAFSMRAGTVLIGGVPGVRAGANMIRGTVILLTPPQEMLPTFRYNYTGSPSFWPLLLASLDRADCALPDVKPHSTFECYSADFLEGGRGEILLHRLAS